MPALPSQMVPLGTAAPAFRLPVVNPEADGRPGDARSLEDYDAAEALVVAFLCNHCPYVHAVEDRLVALAREMAPRGVQFVGVCANDAERYPEDAPEAMAERARAHGYPFPYLHDPTQETARAYDAACTPDFFVYDRQRRLAYRGRLDDGRPGREATTADLRNALEEVLSTGEVSAEQYPSIGCSIKWREG